MRAIILALVFLHVRAADAAPRSKKVYIADPASGTYEERILYNTASAAQRDGYLPATEDSRVPSTVQRHWAGHATARISGIRVPAGQARTIIAHVTNCVGSSQMTVYVCKYEGEVNTDCGFITELNSGDDATFYLNEVGRYRVKIDGGSGYDNNCDWQLDVLE